MRSSQNHRGRPVHANQPNRQVPKGGDAKPGVHVEKHPETITTDQVGDLNKVLHEGGGMLVTEQGATIIPPNQIAALIEGAPNLPDQTTGDGSDTASDRPGENAEVLAESGSQGTPDQPTVDAGPASDGGDPAVAADIALSAESADGDNAEGDGDTDQSDTNEDGDGDEAGDQTTTQEEPASDKPATNLNPNLKPPEARDPTKVTIGFKDGAPNEATRSKPDTANYRMIDKGVKAGHAVRDSGAIFRAASGNNSRSTSVWGQVHAVAQELSKASPDGTFTAQAFFNALFVHDFVKGGAKPKYDPANLRAYTGWIHSLVNGAPNAQFRCVERVSQKAA